MNKKMKLALLGCGAFLLVGYFNITDKYSKINKKLDHITEHTVTYDWESTVQAQKEVIDSLLLSQMELGAKLDSCVLLNN